MKQLYLFLLLLPSLLIAQPARPIPKGWQALTISDGLSQGMIYDLKQDPKGFIWVATKDGLNRYDGYNFTVFTNDLYNHYSLSGNTCTALLVDRRGRLWVGTLNGGLNLYDDRSGRFYHVDIQDQQPNAIDVQPAPADPQRAGNYEVRHIAEDPDGNLWLSGNKNQVFRVSLPTDLKTGFPKEANFTRRVQITQMTLPGEAISGSNGRVYHYNFRPNGTASIGTTYGQYGFNWKHPGSLKPINRFFDDTVEFDGIGDASWGNYWFTLRKNGLYVLQGSNYKLIPFGHRPDRLAKICITREQQVVIASNDFLWIMSPTELVQQDSLTVDNAYMPTPADLPGLTSLMQDRTGLIWIGTNGYGLQMFTPRVKQFRWFLPGRSLSYLCQDKLGRIYVRENFLFSQANLATNRPITLFPPQMLDIGQHFLMQDRRGDFWMLLDSSPAGTYELIRFSAKWQLLNRHRIPPGLKLGDYVGNQIREDQTGQLWVGTANGKLLRFNPATGQFRVFSYEHLLPRNGSTIETHALHFDPTGTLWIGTQAGLVRASKPLTNPLFSIYKNSPANRQSLSNDFVSSVVNDPNEPNRYLWVSTKGGGLERFDKLTGQFRHFTEAQGLPNKVVYGILIDDFKNLWMSTNRGLAQFNPKTFTFRNYTKADGLQEDEFNTGSFFRGASGELLFGGINGLTIFNPKDLMGRPGSTAPACIIGLKVNNEPVLPGGKDGILSEGIEVATELTLAHNQNQVTLEFGVMDYTHPTKNRYRYRLEGIDEDWVEAGTNRFANYAQLPAGTYLFTMMGSVDGEVWSKPVTLQIRVKSPLYRTWWAYLLYLLIIGGVVWQFMRFQAQRLLLQQQVVFEQKEASRLAELDTLKTQFFANISHEFRTPLTLILAPLDDLKQRFPNETVLDLMQRNGQRLLSLINQLLDLGKLEAGQLQADPHPGDMAQFFRTLACSFDSLAHSKRIRFSFTQNADSVGASFDADKLEKIGMNLLGNAFKFTPADGSVQMQVAYHPPQQPTHLRLQVSDTGMGIAPPHLTRIFERFYQQPIESAEGQPTRYYEGTGIGLALVKELVQVMGGQIDVTSEVGKGTTFTVMLPVDATAVPQPVEAKTNRLLPTVDTPPVTIVGRQLDLPEQAVEPDQHNNVLLIIDDNADIRAYVRAVFANDYQILQAPDGQIGLQIATQALPDLIICDLMMPQLDGFAFCRAIKQQEPTSHIPLIMLSARADIHDRIEGFELGADDYLTKPFHRQEIRARVRNLLDQRARLKHYLMSRYTPPVQPPLSLPSIAREDAFVHKARTLVLDHLSERGFDVEQLGAGLNMSTRQVVRKLRALTGQTAVEFIRNVRLEQAGRRLQAGQAVSEVAYGVGFESLPYFTKVFGERYGESPSAYQKKAIQQG